MTLRRPLDRFPLIRAQSTEGARQALSKVYSSDMKFEPLERNGCIDITVNSCQLSRTGLNYTGYGAGAHVRFCGSRVVTLSFPTGGAGRTVIGGTERMLGPEQGLVMPVDGSFDADLSADYQHVVLRMDPQALEEILSAIIGTAVTGPLQFAPLLAFSSIHARILRDNFFFLVDTISRPDASVPTLLQAEFEEAVMVMFLYASRHRYSYLLEEEGSDLAAAEVRRAEDYIEANWRGQITLEALASVTGASVLSLVRSFKKYRNYTPMQFVEQVRNRKRGQN